MKSGFEVIELESGNLAGTYSSIDKALIALVQFMENHGPDQVTSYSLLEVFENGELGESWSDDTLLQRVNEYAVQLNRLAHTS